MSSILEQVKAGGLPDNAKSAVVQGVMPLEPQELIQAIYLIVSEESDYLEDSRATIEQMPDSVKVEVMENRDASPDFLDFYLTRMTLPPEAVDAGILNPQVPATVLKQLSPQLHADHLDLVVNNQVKILEEPGIIEALRENSELTINQKQKLDDYERLLLGDLVQPAEELEDLPVEDVVKAAIDEAKEYVATFGKEKVTSKELAKDKDLVKDKDGGEAHDSILKQITGMTVPQKIQAAIKGNREIRGILVRDANKLVCSAVVKSPRITEAEVEFYSNLRNVSSDVLRLIAINREWIRNYNIMHNLVRNPRAPLAFTTRFVPRLRKKDLRSLQMDKGVPEVLRKMAKRFMAAQRSR